MEIDIDEEPFYGVKDQQEEITSSYYESMTGFIQNNGWYFFAFVILLAYLVPKIWPHYLKWSERRAEAAYDADIKKNPDLYKQKQEELKNARVKFQEEYEKKAKIALEKQKEKEQKLLEEKRELLNKVTGEQSMKSSDKSKKFKPDYNPLMGSGNGSNYRPPRRSPCSGGGCG